MARRPKGQDLQDKVDNYLETYELDDINQANDMAALTQMCQIEIELEKLHNALDDIKKSDILANSKKIREVQSAIRDANQNWTTLQKDLGINRSKRQSEKDESVLQYVDRLQSLAMKFMEYRLKKLVCPSCNQILGKYFFYVTDKGEKGSIDTEGAVVEPYRYTIRHECWKCKGVAEDSNEDIVIVKR